MPPPTRSLRIRQKIGLPAIGNRSPIPCDDSHLPITTPARSTRTTLALHMQNDEASPPPASEDRFLHAPIVDLLGFEIQVNDDDTVTVTLAVDQRHHNPMGSVHGGIACTLADAAMGLTFSRTLLPHQNFATVELKMNFIRPVTATTLYARGKLVRRGMRVGFLECEITDARKKLVGTASCTCLIAETEITSTDTA